MLLAHFLQRTWCAYALNAASRQCLDAVRGYLDAQRVRYAVDEIDD